MHLKVLRLLYTIKAVKCLLNVSELTFDKIIASYTTGYRLILVMLVRWSIQNSTLKWNKENRLECMLKLVQNAFSLAWLTSISFQFFFKLCVSSLLLISIKPYDDTCIPNYDATRLFKNIDSLKWLKSFYIHHTKLKKREES